AFGPIELAVRQLQAPERREARSDGGMIALEELASGGERVLELRSRFVGGAEAQVSPADRLHERRLLFGLILQAGDALGASLEDLACRHLLSPCFAGI